MYGQTDRVIPVYKKIVRRRTIIKIHFLLSNSNNADPKIDGCL